MSNKFILILFAFGAGSYGILSSNVYFGILGIIVAIIYLADVIDEKEIKST